MSLKRSTLASPVSRTRSVALCGLIVALVAGCSNPSDPFTPGANVNTNPNAVFATLMQRPDIDQATQQYQQLGAEIRRALGAAIPTLASWTASGDLSGAGCGNDYPGIPATDGAVRDLPDYLVPGKLPDNQYEQALSIIGETAQKYGFTPTPQRLHDTPGSHDAFFHNINDDGTIHFGTDQNTLLGISIGCHLTAEAKKRGALPPTS